MANALRVVLDPGILISAIITPHGATGEVTNAIMSGRVQPVVCPHLVDELTGVLHRPKFRRWLTIDEAQGAVETLMATAEYHPDPAHVPSRCRDPKDDYLIALTIDAAADALVSGDNDLAALPRHRPGHRAQPKNTARPLHRLQAPAPTEQPTTQPPQATANGRDNK
jgi:putative PIN family toxin of toxin-antitoxin system